MVNLNLSIILCQYLSLIEDINNKISVLEKIISQKVAKDIDTELLKTIPGIGSLNLHF